MSDADDTRDLAKAAAAARRGWAAVVDAGGLLTIPGIAEEWGVGTQTVRDHTEHPDFPRPVDKFGRSEVYLAAEVAQYRATPRKPGPRPQRPSK